MSVKINGVQCRHGDVITGTINGDEVTGKLNHNTYTNGWYFCQNEFYGSQPDDRFGYKYGWCFYVDELGIAGSDVVILSNQTFDDETPSELT